MIPFILSSVHKLLAHNLFFKMRHK